MGFLDALFGGDKKPESHREKPKPVQQAEHEEVSVLEASAGLPAEMLATIVAAAYTVTNEQFTLRIHRGSQVWMTTGRQKNMDAREFA